MKVLQRFTTGLVLLVLLLASGLACQNPSVPDPGPVTVNPGNEPGEESGQEPGNEIGDEPDQEPGDEPGQEPAGEPGEDPGDKPAPEPKPVEPKPAEPKPEPIPAEPDPDPAPLYYYFDPNNVDEVEGIFQELEARVIGSEYFGARLNEIVIKNTIALANHIPGSFNHVSSSLTSVDNFCLTDMRYVESRLTSRNPEGSRVYDIPVHMLFAIKEEQDFIKAFRQDKVEITRLAVSSGCTAEDLERAMLAYRDRHVPIVLNNTSFAGTKRSSLGTLAQYTVTVDLLQVLNHLKIVNEKHVDPTVYDELFKLANDLGKKVMQNDLK